MPKEDASYNCLSLIMLEQAKAGKKYDLQTRLEECKYETKETTTENLINDLESSSSDNGTESGSDNERNNE